MVLGSVLSYYLFVYSIVVLFLTCTFFFYLVQPQGNKCLNGIIKCVLESLKCTFITSAPFGQCRQVHKANLVMYLAVNFQEISCIIPLLYHINKAPIPNETKWKGTQKVADKEIRLWTKEMTPSLFSCTHPPQNTRKSPGKENNKHSLSVQVGLLESWED